MPNRILRAAVFTSMVIAASGCTKLTTIGWSGEHEGEISPVIAAQRQATQVLPSRGMLIQPELPALGDVDGDGFDDFFLMTWALQEPSGGVGRLYYGRNGFPAQLRAEEADASFDVGMPVNNPLGDINGDGFADFALGDKGGYELIFGGPVRFTGHHEKLTTGAVRWSYDAKPVGTMGWGTQFDRFTKLGDTNGDGFDDFAVKIFEEGTGADNLAGFVVSEYVIMGRKDGWPSGKWDARWAAADFGVDPMSPYPQDAKLSVIGSGDFDGDGLKDIIANGADRQWLFYGRREGFHGTLSPDNADAELYFGRLAWPYVLGDLDDDGADELATFWLNDFSVYYGSKQRWSGRVEPKPELVFFDQGSYNNPVVGDLNSDGHSDLLFVGNADTQHWDDWPQGLIHFVVYQVKGTGKRLTGRVQLGSEDVYRPIGYSSPEVLDTGGFNLHVGGDLDGDGSSDLIVGAPGQEAPEDSYVLLLPGATRTPD